MRDKRKLTHLYMVQYPLTYPFNRQSVLQSPIFSFRIRGLALRRTRHRWDGSNTVEWSPCALDPHRWVGRAPGAARLCPPKWTPATGNSSRSRSQAQRYSLHTLVSCILGTTARRQSDQQSTSAMSHSWDQLSQNPHWYSATTGIRCRRGLTLARLPPC